MARYSARGARSTRRAGPATSATADRKRPTKRTIKEAMTRRRIAAEDDDGTSDVTDTPITVTNRHLSVALDQLLDTRSRLTQALLGGGPSERQQGPASL
jgi:hypothetical protein